MKKSFALIWLGVSFAVAVSTNGAGDVAGTTTRMGKRSAAPERLPEDYPDYLFDVKYDDYPMIVPRKRAALLVDRLMVALQKAIEEEEQAREMEAALAKNKGYPIRPEDAVRSMDLQRRGHGSMTTGQQKGRVYWRCYFNAVTCF